MNRKLKERDLSNAYIYLITVLARVREIKNDIHEINEYIIYEIYLSNEKNKNERVVTIKTISRKIYLIDKLVVDMLLRNDILVSKEIDFLFSKKIAYIDSYDVNILIEVHLKEPLIRRVINLKKVFIIPSHSNVTVTIYYLNLFDRNFLFKSRENSILFLYAELINKNIETILIKNNSDKSMKIQRNMKLDNFSNLIINECYHVTFG